MDRLRRAFASRRRRAVAAAIVLVALATSGLVVGLARADGTTLQIASGNGQGRTTPAEHGTFYFGDLCVKGEGSVELVAVEPRRATPGSEVSGFAAVRFARVQRGFEHTALAHEPTLGRTRSVTERCVPGVPATATSLVVEVTRHGPSASVDGLRIWYRDGTRLRSLDADGSITICRDEKACP
ncbi:hypothetical protein [Aeromicrobium sp. IC_218]|uniref:hypothetical protein n=1 Tax=Aeromicrobium sp. IC_218 TaxID=2545468 RepID=UPI00103A5A63|nr:hypothetical protein [Aeromicrobium sp. IC_218]TCI96958.1 hypothetical protein E0W78_13030 [Aeromicrobium sp. IC_218]